MLTYLRKKMRTIMIIVAVVFAASMFYGITMSRRFERGDTGIKDIAKVNGKKVDLQRYSETLNRIASQLGQNIQPQDVAFIQNLALGQTIDFMLLLNEAKKKVRVSNREVNVAIDDMIKREKLTSKKDLEKALKRMGLSMNNFKKMVKEEMLVQKMITKVKGEVKVTPRDLREVRASHILVSQEATAVNLLEKLKKGENFSSLAKTYSIDPGSASKGGDLGYFVAGTMVEPFEKAAFSLKVGEISDVVETDFGYHIIKVIDSRLREFPGEEKDIEKAALAEKQERAFRDWFTNLKGKAKVEIINPGLRAHDLRFRGMINEAIQMYKKAISLSPSDPYLHIFLGDTYGSAGKSDLAIAEYEAAIKIEGGNPLFYMILAKAYEKDGQKDSAIEQYKRASLVAGDNKAMHEELLKKFKELKAWEDYRREKDEIARIEKKEQFEKELKGEE